MLTLIWIWICLIKAWHKLLTEILKQITFILVRTWTICVTVKTNLISCRCSQPNICTLFLFFINKTAIKFWLYACFCFSFLCGGQYQWLPILCFSVHLVGRYPYWCCSLTYKKLFLKHNKCTVKINSVCSVLCDFWFFFIAFLHLQSFESWIFWTRLCVSHETLIP